VFKPAPMIQVNALVLQRDERALLYGLGRAGVVHLSRTAAGPQTAPLEPPDRSLDLAHCDELLRRIQAVRQVCGVADAPALEEPDVLALEQVDERLLDIERTGDDLTRRRTQLEQQWSQVAVLLDQISGYQDVDLPLDELGKFAFLHFAIGSLPGKNLEKLRATTEENVVLLPLRVQGERQPIVAVTSRKGRFAMETTLQQAGFRHEQPPVGEGGDVKTLIEESRAERGRLAAELEQVRNQQQRFAAQAAPELALLEHAVRQEQAILQAEQHFPHTETAVLVTGWVPAEQAEVLVEQLKHATGERCVIHLENPDRVPVDEIPVLLRQPRWLRPFGALVTGYGLPGYRDLEPTLLVAVSYMLMFGIMFGDVGHGGVLALGGLAAMLICRDQKKRDYGLLVLMAGIASVLFGAVYGSYFGIPALHHYGLWHDPLHDPVRLMVAAMAVGVLMISLGVVLNIVNAFRRGEVLHGVLDKFGLVGVVFYWGSLVLIVKYSTLSELGLAGLVLVLVVVLPLLAMTLKEPLQYVLSKRAGHQPHANNLGMAFIESAIEAFEATLSYLANTISFVRLAAYAMSHAAILMATFAVAEALAPTPGIGDVLYVIIAVFGNLVALILEGVVVAVQVLRLEYYEFFGKFFSGSGLPFRPFSFLGKEKEVP
jgi:V/A-type H+/Na+-transporting ATPase subunit I